MKVNLLLIAFLFTVLSVFTTSCDSSNDKTCDPECTNAWETCNTKTGNCEVKTGFCSVKADCDGAKVCGLDHKCKEPMAEECKNQCLDQHSVVQGTCSVVGGLPTCECNEGYLKSPNGLRCLEKTADCNDEATACGGHGDCIAQNNGTLGCKCDTDYIPDATDPMLCSPTVICSNSNHDGTCEASCEECLDDGTGNWKCKVPEGERPCYKNFNDQCDPSLGYSNNPGCASDMVCEGDTAEDGYCTVRTCEQDSQCPPAGADSYGDQFVCKYYGTGFIGICIKADDDCFNADGTRKGGGEEGDACSDKCKEADCNVGNLCEKGSCSKKCSGPTDLTCGTDRGCVDLTGGQGDARLYYCAGPIVGAGEDCLDAVCANGLSCLGDQQTWANCFKPCTTVGSEDECASVGAGSKCENFGQVGNFCGAPQTQQPGEECDQFAHGCADDGWCLGTGGDNPSYCFEKCTTASDASNECTGNTACVHFGTAPNDGYYCDIAPSRNAGEECDMVHTCMNDGWCLGSGADSPSYCFDKCETAGENSTECPGNTTCVHFGTAPNDGNYCEVAPNKDFGEACDMVNTCMNDGLCLTTNDGASCFESCTDASSVCTQGENFKCVDTQNAQIGWICMEQTPPGNTAIGGDCSGVADDATKNCVAGATCLTTQGTPPVSTCYEDCDVNAPSCSTTGYTCQTIPDVGDFCMAAPAGK